MASAKEISQKFTEKLVHAYITCHLDNNNGLLYGIPDTLLRRMQHIRNSAASTNNQKEKNLPQCRQFYKNFVGYP